MNCPNCGATIRPNAAFCTACGTRVAQRTNRLKSTMPTADPAPAETVDAPLVPEPTPSVPPEPAPCVQPEPTPEPPVETPVPEAPPAPEATNGTPYEPTPAERVRAVYDAADKSARPPVPPGPMPEPVVRSAPEEHASSRSAILLKQIRGYVAVALAVCSLVLLFLPWFSTGMEVEIYDVSVLHERYDLVYGDVAVRDDASRGTELSILDVVQFRKVTDLVDLRLENKDARDAMKKSGRPADQRIEEFIGLPSDLVISDGFRLPTGLVMMAPQVLCILLMFLFFLIGVLRVFVADPFPDGAPRTGWLKAGGIVGLVMSAVSALEVFVINYGFERYVESIVDADFEGSIDLCVRLITGFFLFALVSLLLTLAATHWQKRNRKG